ncbi:MAG: metallophosphoesterase [Deltaproteobacteria bacterium]|nr:metallophosphoesterase [Deltaproteobacteria bacterium]
MKLHAISDLHVGFKENREALRALPARPDDWLILCGDVGDTPEQLAYALDVLGRKFGQLLWVPGNHELWTVPRATGSRGVARYAELVELCRGRGVLTPEDPFPVWTGEGGPHLLAPLFLLYDYSFRPDEVPVEQAVAWAQEENLMCADEVLLHPDPYPGFGAWCEARCLESERRLEEALAQHPGLPTILIAHFPLKQRLALLPRIPRFMVWCGTRRTEDWHLRFRAAVVVSGHLHIPSSRSIDGVRFEEVSLGYPEQWRARAAHRGWGFEDHVRPILPAPEVDAGDPLAEWLAAQARGGGDPTR